MRVLLALVASLGLVSGHVHHRNLKQAAHFSPEQTQKMFSDFVKLYNKKYAHDDFFNRYNVFAANCETIRAHNMKEESYTLGLNEFADLTFSEFRASKLGYKHQERSYLRSLNEVTLDASAAPTSVDWRTKGIVTPVKNQGQCGSCWSFSTTGSVEGAHAQATGTLVSLSEQQLVDCSTAEGNQGCNGGLMDDAFEYIIKNKGITTEAAYPYTATGPNTCKKGLSVAATISSYKDVPAGDETTLLAAAAQQPVSVAIEADQAAFQLYSGGVLTAKCGTNLDHGVLVVGYGEQGSTPYWIVKNSWGATWGEEGYIRMVRGKNECGISNSASYPIV